MTHLPCYFIPSSCRCAEQFFERLESAFFALRLEAEFHDNSEELVPGFVSYNNLLYSVK